MANKAISELPQAQNVNNQDLFVLEQSGIAKKLTAETFITEQGIIDALAEALDGHGGIQSVTLQSLSGRVRTYLITFSDGSATTFQVLDGSTITNIQKTSTAGLVDTYTVFMSDGTTSFFQVRNGQDGSATWDQINSKAPIITDTATGAIANFPDGADDIPVTSLVANIEPKQDLTYGDPYPASGGANKLDPDEVTVYSSSVYGFTVTWNANDGSLNINGTYTGSGSSAVFRALKVPSAVRPLNVKGFSSSSKFSLMRWQDGADQIVAELTGMVQNSSYNITIYPIVYEGSTAPASWTPYENICPITGWTGCNVKRTGKNLFDESQYQNLTSTYEYSNDSYHCKAIQLVPNTTFTVSHRAGTADSNVIALINNVQKVNNGGFFDLRTASGSKTFTTDSTGCLYIGVLYSNDTAYNARLALCQVQIELGSTATAYEPYIAPTTVSLSWQNEAGTVYGGTVDVATGLLTVNGAMVDLGDLTWTYNSGQLCMVSQDIKNLVGNGANVICDRYATTTDLRSNPLSSRDKVVGINKANSSTSGNFATGALIVKDTSYTNASTFKTAVTGSKLVYELATPQTYQLTGQQLKTLLGTNNVWADTGNISVTYPADTKMFIEKLTMPTEDDLVANQAITSGKYFMIGNSLYLALANIASGAQITIGTNAQRVSLADALNTINS